MTNGFYELPYEPPEDFRVKADCGDDVFEYEHLYTFEGKTLCPDCMRQKFEDMSTDELAALIGCEHIVVRKDGANAH